MNRLFLLFISVITIGTGAHAMEHLSLIEAARDGKLEMVRQCIDERQDINQIDESDITPLLYAAHNGHLKIVKYLIKAGATIDQTDGFGRTSLIWAVRNYHLSVVECLIKAGAAIDQKDDNSTTALTYAAINGHLPVVECLLNAGANASNTALAWAALKGHLSVVECLINVGTAINDQNERGDTALMHAANKNHLQCCQALVRGMLRPSAEQKNRIYEFLLCMKSNKNETIAAGYTFCILDVFKRHLRALIKEENKPRAIAEIEKINNQDIKNQLLAFCE